MRCADRIFDIGPGRVMASASGDDAYRSIQNTGSCDLYHLSLTSCYRPGPSRSCAGCLLQLKSAVTAAAPSCFLCYD